MCRLKPFMLILITGAIFLCFHQEMFSSNNSQGQLRRISEKVHVTKNTTVVSIGKGKNSEDSMSPYKTCISAPKPAKDNQATQMLERHLPKCLIIGFAKCGTYALKSFLTLHSHIVSPNREISFFTKYYHKGINWYRSQMPLSQESAITIEKTPSYILSVEALSRIRAFNNSIKLIVAIRDPVTRLQSSYAHAQASAISFNETFESWLTRKGTIARVADYETHLRNVYHIFHESQVLLVHEEQLKDLPLSVMRDVERFLGLCHALTNDMLTFDHVKGFYCFNQSNPRYQEMQDTLTLDPNNGCFTRSKGRAHATIEPQLLKHLLVKLAPYNDKLYALLGQRFNWTRLSNIN